MSIKNINLFSREDYFDKVFPKSGSYHSLNSSKNAIRCLDRFCTEQYSKDTNDVLSEIREAMMGNPNNVIPMIFLEKFSSFLQNEEKSTSCIKGYVNFAKKYLRQCGGIRISVEDMQDYIAIPVDEEGDEDLEQLTHDELRAILDNIPNQRRKAFYMVLKDAGCRIGEGLQLKKKYFDLSKTPATVFLPKRITKGKKIRRIQRLTHETVKTLHKVFERLNDEDYLTQSNKGDGKFNGYKTERDAFVRVLEKSNLTEKYEHNGRYKKNIHSIRSFCYTQCKQATGDADYAHGYVGHDRYLVVYDRMEEKQQDEMFNRCVPKLSVFEDVVVLSQDDANEKINALNKKVEKLTEILENISEHQTILRPVKKKLQNIWN
ncbi:MAG: site-specific integrase [Nitrosopumilus sp.]|nr:site-specific integrase [Nitrosopumilus sp.]